MREDIHGLRYEIDPPDTQRGRDLVELIRRGDVRSSSFGFMVNRENLRRDKTGPLRELLDVRLLDVSPVVIPAYPATTAKLWGDGVEGLCVCVYSSPRRRYDRRPAYKGPANHLRQTMK